QAFDFNGPTGHSHIVVPDAPDIDFSNTMTVEAWVKVRTYAGSSGEYEIVSKLNGPANPAAYAYTFAINTGLQKAYFVVDGLTTSVAVYSATTIPLNQWVHLAGVDDGTKVTMYVDGQFSASLPWTLGIAPDPNPLVIGCSIAGTSPTSFFNGQIDEASLYKRALSSNEIASIYNAGPAGKFGWFANSLDKPYLDTDQDGIPDFWEITFGQPPYVPSNNQPSTNVLGYTTLEEYNNWLAGPHALTVTNTPVGVDLQQLFGQTGNLSFFVTNAVHGSVYLTNVLGAVTNTGVFSNSIAVFVPTNTTPVFSGFASFDAYVTNNDTVAYFGPVTVSVVVSDLAVAINSNIPPVIHPLGLVPPPGLLQPAVPGAGYQATNTGGSDFYVFAVTNLGTMSPVAVLFSVTNATGPVDLVANYGNTLPLPSLSAYEFISTNPWPAGQNILISSNSTPVAITNGYWYLAVVNVAGSNVVYDISATELFSVNPPVFLSPTNTQVFTNVETFPFTDTCVATDPNTPALPLTFALARGPTNMMVTPGGLITWTPTLEQGPTTNGPSTNTIAVSVSNGDFVVTNTFTIIVLGTNIPPTLPNQPNQVVIVPNGTLVVTNTGTNPNLPNYPLVYTLLNPPPGASIDPNGIITWAPPLADAGSNFVITTVVTDTNPWAVNATSLSATNSFTVFVETGILPGQPQTNTVPAGGLNWIAVPVPADAVIATNTLLFATNLPVNLWFSTNVPPTITNPGDAELLVNATNGSRILLTNGV
ncbi:MAG TPA: LamG domain-containing protein, partial [Candidatus Acidoferrum sp.]|nr:LamG domain-containing protein [Candidatus Acidoferrum sp.]